MASKWKIKDGTVRLSQDTRLKSERTVNTVMRATAEAAHIGEIAMKQQIMSQGTDWRRRHPTNPSSGRVDTGNMHDKVSSTSSTKKTSVEATFGWLSTSGKDFYFIFQDEGFEYIHGNNPHFVPGVHAQLVGAIRAREYLQSILKRLNLRRVASTQSVSLSNPKYGG